jgi:hypothetical protein
MRLALVSGSEVVWRGRVWRDDRRLVAEGQLGLRRRPRGMKFRSVEGEPEVFEGPFDAHARRESRHDLHSPLAARALEDVLEQDAPDQRGPRKAAT